MNMTAKGVLVSKSKLINVRQLELELQKTTISFVDKEIIEVATNYPPPPPNSTYVRTGKLGTSFKRSTSSANRDFTVAIDNDATDPRGRQYAKYVYGPWQTQSHNATGWLILRQLMRKALPGLVKTIKTILNKYTK